MLLRCLPWNLYDSKLLDEKSASYLAVFFPTEVSWTLLFAELLTGQLFVTVIADKTAILLDAELQRYMPDEILVPQTKLGSSFGSIFQSQGYAVSFEPTASMKMRQREFPMLFRTGLARFHKRPFRLLNLIVYPERLRFYTVILKETTSRALRNLSICRFISLKIT